MLTLAFYGTMQNKDSRRTMALFPILLSSVLLAVVAQNPLCFITAPATIHVGVEETVTAQVLGATRPFKIALFFSLLEGIREVSERKEITLTEQNDYQALVKLKVDPTRYPDSVNKKKNIHPDFVQLVAESKDVFQQTQRAKIRLSSKKGYIFIQTDKPIYNPGENVNFRVFTLDNYLLPTDEVISIQIFNSRNVRVYSQDVQSAQILQKNIHIPDVEPAGLWKIVASFLKSPLSASSVEFDVRDYVLPSFEVKIEAPKPYLTLREESFSFTVSARYTYGKGISGIAYVRFGLNNEDGDRLYLIGTEKQTKIENGMADVSVLTADLQRAAENQNVSDIVGNYLYIAVTALEKASGQLEDTESTFVKIVDSPYVIDLSKTKQYFSPQSLFSILASVSYPDGTPVPNLRMRANITVKPVEETWTLKGFGNTLGEVMLSFQVPALARSMDIQVFAEGDDNKAVFGDVKMSANAVRATHKTYLTIELDRHFLAPDQSLTITFRDITPQGTARPTHIYYMILNKGRVLHLQRVQRTEVTSVSVDFSVDLVPSFRIVAYFFTIQPEGTTVVSDSVLVDVKDVCDGQIEIAPFSMHKPAQSVDVVVKTDMVSKVALAAVDTAVYILNKQHKLTPHKMFAYMNSYDLGCSVGGGKDHKSVLQDAGLTFICNCNMKNDGPYSNHKCNSKQKRQKRSLDKAFSKIVNRYKHPERKCCGDAIKPDRLKRSCEERVKKTTQASKTCRDVFYKCCKDAEVARRENYLNRIKNTYGRALSNEVENALEEGNLHIRSFFPQSWLWLILDTDESGLLKHSVITPDSITTWEIQAVRMSPTKGFCVAEPKPLKVEQDFFVSVKLPYSVKRNEQLEVKAVVYNYLKETLEVLVKMEKVEGLCTAGEDGVEQNVTVQGSSAVAVYFSVVPLITGNIPITVLAYSSTIRDKIQKQLKVVGEGELISLHSEYSLNANGDNFLEVKIESPPDTIPGEEITSISIKGGIMGESVENSLNLEGVDKLIALPTGCAEQAMVKMSPAIHSIRYLDTAGLWPSLKAGRRNEAISLIQDGYHRVLSYKKVDGSYGAFLSTPSSVWLTAFIAKELAQSKELISVEDSYIQEAMTYVISKQTESGTFTDPNPVLDRTMKGGIGNTEGDAAMTAFILIAMQHASKAYDTETDQPLRKAMEKARSYLEEELDDLNSPYDLAITAYALSLTSPTSKATIQALDKLMEMAICDEVKETCHWDTGRSGDSLDGSQANSASVETTAYALLYIISQGNNDTATSIAKWLTEQRKYGGGFRSTQDTVVALEALAKLSMQDKEMEQLDLTVQMRLQNGRKEKVHLNKHNALTQPSIEIENGGGMSVRVKGRGSGTLSIMHSYRSLKMPESFCDHFHLEVSLTGEVQYSEEYEPIPADYYSYDSDEDLLQREESVDKLGWFDLRMRRKRQAPEDPEKETSLVYKVCLGKKTSEPTGMVIVDISLLSGLKPNIQDLENIAKGTEKYIDHYEIHQNKVYLYFNKVTEGKDCLLFGVEQIVPIGLVQPAAAVIYDYYNPERRCGVFYNAPQKNVMLSKLCDGAVCICAEGDCPKLQETFKITEQSARSSFACYSARVDYVYVVQIFSMTEDDVFIHYNSTVTKVLQLGGDDEIQRNAVREMIHRKACGFKMKRGSQYLIMGTDDQLTRNTREVRYILDRKMWIEEIPEEAKCAVTRRHLSCKLLQDFMQNHLLNKCSV
ncbi:complement C4-A isoform X2 [Chanos chanos]|uniref:Complement C4-A isoform X2 n=1 Tax=Chanos chanos TaxID=29144 RepID=A0A6J2VJL3_CHACN|nr:complement C4-A-like isoform X2 [Chanos chanos]